MLLLTTASARAGILLTTFGDIPALDEMAEVRAGQWCCKDCGRQSNNRLDILNHFLDDHLPLPSTVEPPNVDDGDRISKYLLSLLFTSLFDYTTRQFVKTGDGRRLWITKRFGLVTWGAAVSRETTQKISLNLNQEEKDAKSKNGPIKYRLATHRSVLQSLYFPASLARSLMYC